MFKRRGLFIRLFLTLLFLLGEIVIIHQLDLRLDTELKITAAVSSASLLKLQAGADNAGEAWINPATPGTPVKPVTFHLPGRDINELQLLIYGKKGVAAIQSVEIKSFAAVVRYENSSLQKVFVHSRGMQQVVFNNHAIQLQTAEPETLLEFSEDIYRDLDRVNAPGSVYGFLAVLLALFFFYVLHNFSPRGSRVFFTRRVWFQPALLFLILIFLPLTDNWCHFSRLMKLQNLQENRALTPKPFFRLAGILNYLQHYQRYYDDHFQSRNIFIYAHSLIKLRCFEVSPLPGVLLGKDDWLFLARENHIVDEVDYLRGLRPFTQAELEQWWSALEQRWSWCKEHGVVYLFAVVPNKSTIYSRFLPTYLQRAATTRLDQLLAYLKEKNKESGSKFPILDLRPVFTNKETQTKRLLYYKTDTHWNEYGAYLAYRRMMRYLGRFYPGEKAMPLNTFDILEREGWSGDLANQFYLQGKFFREAEVLLHSRLPDVTTPAREEPLRGEIVQYIKESPVGRLPAAVMVHDSFGERLKIFFSRHFSRIVYIHDKRLSFYPEIIEKEGAKILIDEMVERFLLCPSPGIL